ncbi:hypothetical protein Vadar_013752 [Vaccinium darrowii]|uniref:Uncharacterized protein n=1 Tax=Vaccinium darrowii TaxID=229202 RepID=A0ACB7ZJT3_9ERIC|nr:hypothetical protein Vadar_013752 [Vaccinium darrowii]
MLVPLNGKDLWTTAITQQMLPPDVCRRGGRPKKARRIEPGEQATDNPDPTRLGRKGSKMRCNKCDVLGHNKRRCRKGLVHYLFNAIMHEPIVEESGQPIVEEATPVVEQSAHGTSGQVRRNMKKAKQGMVEEGPTQSQP